jgi:farnesyl diphosphate synthase
VLRQNNYGRHDPACVAAIKALYRELNVLTEYDSQEEDSYKRIAQQIADADAEGILPSAILQSLLVLIHKRTK